MSGSPVRVAIVASEDVVATGLEGVLAEDPSRIEVVEFQSLGNLADPDVVLYDVIGLHEGDQATLEHLVKETSAAVIAIARDLRPDLAARALAKGVDGCISMSAPRDQILQLIFAAADGQLAGDVTVDEPGLEQPFERLGLDVGLTARETEVLRLITRGFTNLEIADQLYLSINSVKTYVRSAYRRLEVTSRSQAVAWCIQHGFDPPSS